MTAEDRFKQMYESGFTPWDIGKPDINLIETITSKAIIPCKALDIGCGTGDNSIWLAQNGFQVTGVDISEVAIEKATEKASKENVKCTFMVIDFLTNKIAGRPFGFAFDRGCFHSLKSDEERTIFAENVADHLDKNGIWLSLVGNADEQRNRPGPPQRTARDIVDSVEPYFEILSLATGHFGSNHPSPPRCWVCLMRKRRAA